jgi:PAS domain S-box-containing protein
MMDTDETPVFSPSGKSTERDDAVRRTQRELEALRREIERWRVLTGGDQGLLEALLHHSPHGIFVCDSAGRFILQNRAAERIWAGSATLGSVAEWGVYRAYHPDGRPYEAGDWSMARCLTRREIVDAEEVHFQRFDGTHGILLGSCAPILGPNGDVDGALGVFADITALKQVEERLQLITDSLPVSIAYVDRSLHYRFANLNYERWFGLQRSQIEGRPVREIIGPAAFEVAEPFLARAFRGETLTYQAAMPYLHGGERFVEVTYIPHRGPDRSVVALVVLVNDISERKRMERERARWTERTEQLLDITAALADAVTPAQVLAAVVDHASSVLHASSCGLWLVDAEQRCATLARSFGDTEEQRAGLTLLPLDGPARTPVLSCLLRGEPEWSLSAAALAADRAPGDHAVSALPLTVEGRRIGALVFTFDGAGAPSTEEDRSLLLVVARHSAQALERVRLLREAQQSYEETTLLYRLTDAVNRAGSVEMVYETSLDTIRGALGLTRSAILFFDAGGDVRFEASRGLSEACLEVVRARAPWLAEALDAGPVHVDDVAAASPLAEGAALFAWERIAALAFVPLVYESRLLGGLMLCRDEPRALSEREKSVARSIADQVASAVGKKRAQAEKERLIEKLSRTVHLNELFTGVVGHDLRNPLSAIMSTAQLALRRDEGERLRKPLRRVLVAGERMMRMIEQLLDFTRSRVGGGIPVDLQEMDLGEVGRRVLDEIEDANPERPLVAELTGDLRGRWDPDRLAQVISNLAGNAVQHGSPETGVMLSFDGRLTDAVVLRVQNGGHLRPELLPALFEPFHGPDLRKERSKGLGLGLYITHQIVLAHGGNIEVSSSAETGTTTFTVTLPRRVE